MSQELNLSLSFAPGKEHALLPKPVGRQNPQAESAAATTQGPPRDSGLQWGKVENKVNGKMETDLQLLFSPSNELGATTVTTPEAVKAPASVFDIRLQMQQKFMELLEQAYANCFHHNRLVAKVAEWTVGNILGRLALLKISPKELDKIKRRIRKRLIEQNATALFQVVYDETMLEIVT